MKSVNACLLILVSFFSYCGAAYAAKVETVSYQDGSVTLEGTLAYPEEAKASLPGILLFHEWWGKNDYAVSRAKQFADLGYVVLAADVYGKGVLANKAEDAKKLSAPFYEDRKLLRSRASKAFSVLISSEKVDPNRIAAIGYCFGGTTALELGRSGAALKGLVVFHGGLGTTEAADNKSIKAPVLVLNGADDPFIPVKEREEFKASLKQFGIPLTWVDYPGAVHAFTNPKVDSYKLDGAKYNKAADEKSWLAAKKFLTESLE